MDIYYLFFLNFLSYMIEEGGVYLIYLSSCLKYFYFFFSLLMNDGLNFGNIGSFSTIFIVAFFFSIGV